MQREKVLRRPEWRNIISLHAQRSTNIISAITRVIMLILIALAQWPCYKSRMLGIEPILYEWPETRYPHIKNKADRTPNEDEYRISLKTRFLTLHPRLTVCMKYVSYLTLWSRICKWAASIYPTISVRMSGDPFLFKLQDENHVINATSANFSNVNISQENIQTELVVKFAHSQQDYPQILYYIPSSLVVSVN